MKYTYYFSDGHNSIDKVVSSKNMNPNVNGSDTGVMFIMEDEDHQTVLLNSLNMMRKSRTFCDVILNVSLFIVYVATILLLT